jgi:hypothetical protein
METENAEGERLHRCPGLKGQRTFIEFIEFIGFLEFKISKLNELKKLK